MVRAGLYETISRRWSLEEVMRKLEISRAATVMNPPIALHAPYKNLREC